MYQQIRTGDRPSAVLVTRVLPSGRVKVQGPTFFFPPAVPESADANSRQVPDDPTCNITATLLPEYPRPKPTMGVISVSIVVASVIWVIVRPPPWLTQLLLAFRARPALDPPKPAPDNTEDEARGQDKEEEKGAADAPVIEVQRPTAETDDKAARDRAAMPPPPVISPPSAEQEDKAAKDRAAMPPPPVVKPPTTKTAADPNRTDDKVAKDRAAMPPPPLTKPSNTTKKEEPEQTTPKAGPSKSPRPPVPDFALPPPSAPTLQPPPSFPAANSPQRASNGPSPTPNRLPSLFPPPSRPNPLPNRAPPSSSSSLAPPPTHSAPPPKPNRKVMLSPGHSPLDWAAISGPSADLRNLGPSAPYLRVTPSMLKKQNGRKGSDAWMVLGGKVYNVSPYANYHPGGVGELLRGAGKDGTRLFGEVHPWVNYEGMLQACLVGIFVEEGEKSSSMEDMD